MATNYIIKGFNEVKVEDSVVPSPIFDCFSVTSLQFMAPESTYFSDEALSPRSKILICTAIIWQYYPELHLLLFLAFSKS